MKAVCSGWGFSGVPSPVKVTIFLPVTEPTGVTQDRVALPLTWTVQAPHWARPQPKCGLFRPMSFLSA